MPREAGSRPEAGAEGRLGLFPRVGLGALAEKHQVRGCWVQSHMAESPDEEAFVEALHPGKRDAEIFDAADLEISRAALHATSGGSAARQEASGEWREADGEGRVRSGGWRGAT